MHKLSKLFAACGLVILTGPLCLTALAQDYVDVEAERAAQSTASAPKTTDPYGAAPATAYPATSYGVNSAAAAVPTLNVRRTAGWQ